MTTTGIQRLPAGATMTRHRHARPYAALVLAGSYVEAGDCGRVRVGPGDVVFHRPHDAHLDTFARRDVVILNLPASDADGPLTATVDDVDAIVRLAERDAREAAHALRVTCRASRALLDDWPDRLAAALAGDGTLVLGDWAVATGIAPQSVSRGFQRVYGVSPKRYRLEQRALRAIRRLDGWRGSLADLAAETGFADQAHMGRVVAAVTGSSPGRMRVQSFQDAGGEAP